MSAEYVAFEWALNNRGFSYDKYSLKVCYDGLSNCFVGSTDTGLTLKLDVNAFALGFLEACKRVIITGTLKVRGRKFRIKKTAAVRRRALGF